MELFTPKIVKALKNMGLGSGIWKKPIFWIPDPGVKRHWIPDPNPQHWILVSLTDIGDNVQVRFRRFSKMRETQ
jgi:hypothetical protein